MTSALVASWTAYFKHAEQLIKKPPKDKDFPDQLKWHTKLFPQSLPHAALKRLVHDVQVTRRIVALCIQAHQQGTTTRVQSNIASILYKWLQGPAFDAPAESHLAVSSRQQLQDSGLLQHMTALLTDASDRLTAAGAAAFAAPAISSASNLLSPDQAACDAMHDLLYAVGLAGKGILIHTALRFKSFSTSRLSLEAVLPSAPAAVRLSLAIYQTCSRVQELAGREDSHVAVLLLAKGRDYQQDSIHAMGYVISALLQFAVAMHNHSSSLHSVTGAHELLLCPELIPSLASTVLVAVLGVDTGTGQASGSVGGTRDAVRPASSSRRNAGSTSSTASCSSRDGAEGSSRIRVVSQARGASQQLIFQGTLDELLQSAVGAAGSTGRHQAGSTSSATSISASGTLGNGVSLDSLTPLSCRLLDLLGVNKDILLQAARGAADVCPQLSKYLLEEGAFICVMKTVCDVLEYQVKHLTSACGTYNAQLLQHLELYMLLGLAMHQLTASIPASFSKAQDVRAGACQLNCSPLLSLYIKTSLHKLPLSAAYTGPQLALQVQPSVLGPPLPISVSLEQQPQLPPQQQQLQWYTVTPTAQLLTELLPLLVSFCRNKLQQQQEDLKQLMQVLEQRLQHAAASKGLSDGGQLPGVQGSCVRAPANVLGTVEKLASSGCPQSLWPLAQNIWMLLCCAVIPSPDLTAAEVQAAATAANAQKYTPGHFNYSCVLHAPDAIAQNARDILHLMEALLRDAATRCDIMIQLHVADAVAAAMGGAGAAQQVTAPAVLSADSMFNSLAEIIGNAIGHEVTRDSPHSPSALALAALSAGPGSKVQRQLFSLLGTMVKLDHAAVRANTAKKGSEGDQQQSAVPVGQEVKWVEVTEESVTARLQLGRAAAFTAAALLAGATEMQQVGAMGGPQPGGDGHSHAAATAMLPSLYILGRYCMQRAQQMEPAVISAKTKHVEVQREPFHQELVIPFVQQWLETSINQQQLVAAGYTPQLLPQQLQQMVAALQALRDSAHNRQPDSSSSCTVNTCGLEAVRQLQAAGSILCSFAVPSLCNNPTCRNLSGLTELSVVSGRSCICAGCGVARYCGRACQRIAWKQHKPVCAALAAAAAIAKAAAGSAVPQPLTGA